MEQPPTLITDINALRHEAPLHHPFVISQRSASTSTQIRLCLDLANGHSYWGEAVPVTYVTGETPDTVSAAIGEVRGTIMGRDVMRPAIIADSLSDILRAAPSAKAAIEMALWNAFSGETGIPLWRLWGGARQWVETSLTISILPEVVELAKQAAESGFHTLKVKMGLRSISDEIERLNQIHQAAPNALLRLDANQAFSPDEAIDLTHRASDLGLPIELIEQPTPKEDWAAIDRVARSSPYPVYADEMIKTPSDALRLVCETEVQGINVKLMKSGIRDAFRIISIALSAGRSLMLGCMLESTIGIGVAASLACGTGAFTAVDLDAHLLISEKMEETQFSPFGPRLVMRQSLDTLSPSEPSS